MEMEREDLEDIFKEGDFWGTAYEGWFTPTEEQTENHIQAAINDILG